MQRQIDKNNVFKQYNSCTGHVQGVRAVSAQYVVVNSIDIQGVQCRWENSSLNVQVTAKLPSTDVQYR